MSNKKHDDIKIVQASETSPSLLDNQDVLSVLGNTTNEPRTDDNSKLRIDAATEGGEEEAATPLKKEKKSKRFTKPKKEEGQKVKCNFAVVLQPEKAKQLSALIEKLDSDGIGKVNANIALNMAVDLLLAKHGNK